MIGWLIMLALAGAVFVLLWRFGRLERSGLLLVGAALCVAFAGYVWQGRPSLAGSPAKGQVATKDSASDFEMMRGSMMIDRLGRTAQVLDTADTFHRQGLDAYAVGIIRGAISRDPNNAQLWVGLANALLLYSDGRMTPAAEFAYKRAEALHPAHPAPAFFHGLALAQAGRFDETLVMWKALVARAPADAPWRDEVAIRAMLLERVMAAQAQVPR